MCYNDTKLTTAPKIAFSDCRVFESDEEKDGYEWKKVDVTLFYYDDSAMNNG